MNGMTVLEVQNFSYSHTVYQPLLKDISFHLEEGGIFCLLGPNGSGKTTLMRKILFPTDETARCIRLYGKPMETISLKERSQLLGYVPQKVVPLQITVLQMVMMGRYPCKSGFFFRPNETDRKAALEAICLMGLEHLADRQLNTLSGGEVQRVFIAQSLAKQAKVYFFDEPMSALDPLYQAEFLQLMQWLARRGAAVMFTTHNPNHLLALQDASVAILDEHHQFRCLGKVSHENLDAIEDVFRKAVHIAFSEQHGAYAALFQKYAVEDVSQ